jgi:hypothetical protein
MRFLVAFSTFSFAIGAIATPNNDESDHNLDYVNKSPDTGDWGQRKICPHLKTQDQGCIRYTRGYDVTGVLTTVTPDVNNECDCIEECIKAATSCANYVWKFNDQGTRRTCTLYSNFNLPPNVTVVYDEPPTPPNQGYNPISGGSPTQSGGLVPEATKPSGEIDEGAVSGPVWQLEGGQVQC